MGRKYNSDYCLNTDGKGLRSLIQHTKEMASLNFFGNMEETGLIECITAQKQDQLARAIYDDYQQKIIGASSESVSYTSDWPTLTEDAKDASRAQADHICFKLALTGKPIADVLARIDTDFSPQEVERLAIIEHNRWMAHRYLHGWDFGTARDDIHKLHPSLVPWKAFSESEKQKDRETILRIPKIFKDVTK